MEKVKELQRMIDESNKIVFFGGAGVSTESDIPDFRSADGLYQEKWAYSPEQIVSHTFFMRKTAYFYEFYKEKMMYLDAKPNAAHQALAKLEAMGKLKAVVTQNIDGLHQLAGSKRVYELHGTVHRNYCMRCHEFYDVNYILKSDGIPRCEKCGGIIKPDVVLYEEGLDDMTIRASLNAIQKADVLIIGGTSLNVYPAAGFIQYYSGDKLILINKSETPYDRKANLLIHDSIGKVLGEVVCDES